MNIKIPQYILNEADKVQKYELQKKKSISRVYDYLEKQGIDTYDESFQDAIGVRLENAEFTSMDEFVEDVNKFVKGENVGYG